MSLEDKIVTLAETIGADVRELKNDKVDKVSGKGLSDRNFTQAEKTKLANIASVTTKIVNIPAHDIDPINAMDLGVSAPAVVSPNEKAGMYARDTKLTLFSGDSRVEVHEDYVQISVITEGVESAFVLEPDDAIFVLMRGEEYEQYSLKEMFRKIDNITNGGGGSVNIAQDLGNSVSAVISQYILSDNLMELSIHGNMSLLYILEQHEAIHALDPDTATLPQLIRALQSATIMDWDDFGYVTPPPEP